MMSLDQSRLMAYADGELDRVTSAAVEQQLADDAEARRRLAQLQLLSAASRNAFDAVLHEPPPQHLVDTILQAGVTAAPGRGVVERAALRPFAWSRLLPVAATVAGMAVGAFAGAEYATVRSQKASALMAREMARNEAAMAVALNHVLEYKLSGETMVWHNPDSETEARFMPIRTYRDKSGAFCREYRQEVMNPDRTDTTFGLACRATDGKWTTRYMILPDKREQNL